MLGPSLRSRTICMMGLLWRVGMRMLVRWIVAYSRLCSHLSFFSVFGVELQFLLRREAMGQEVLPGTLPRVISECLTEVERRGLSEVGICK